MKIKITGRHIDLSEKLKDYAEKRIAKLEKYFHQIIDIHLILYIEKIDHTAELIINGDSIQFHGREKAADLYSAIDLLVDKMDTQIVRLKERIQARKGHSADQDASFEIQSSSGIDAVLSQVSNKPIDSVEAYLQMKNDKKDYILFKKGNGDIDYSNKDYAVMYRNGEKFKLVEVPFESVKDKDFSFDYFMEYEIDIKDSSPVSPKIEFKKENGSSIKKMSLDSAFDVFKNSDSSYMPFFNTDTRYFNILCKKGNRYEVLVPAF